MIAYITPSEIAPFVLLFVLAITACFYVAMRSCYQNGYNAGREDERKSTPAKILQAKKEGAMAERQRLFSPSNISKQ